MLKNIALIALTIIVIYLVVFSSIQANEAAKQSMLAIENALEAQRQQEIAMENAKLAEENAAEAQRQADRMEELLKECQEGR